MGPNFAFVLGSHPGGVNSWRPKCCEGFNGGYRMECRVTEVHVDKLGSRSNWKHSNCPQFV